MNFAPLRQAIIDYVREMSGLAVGFVYFDHQAAPPPPRPCISIHVRNPGRQRGRDGGYATQTDAGGGDGTVLQRFYGNREATVVLSAYGDTAYDLLEAVRRATHTDTGQERALALGIAVVVEEPRSVPALVDGQTYETRFVAEARFSYVATYTEAITPVDLLLAENEAGEDFTFDISVNTEP